jgi:hypothetical protein
LSLAKLIATASKSAISANGGTVWANLNVGCVRKADGAVDYFISLIEDITERKRAETQQHALNAELDHRVKNVLATVSAIIAQTQEARNSRTDFCGWAESPHKLLGENTRAAERKQLARRVAAKNHSTRISALFERKYGGYRAKHNSEGGSHTSSGDSSSRTDDQRRKVWRTLQAQRARVGPMAVATEWIT